MAISLAVEPVHLTTAGLAAVGYLAVVAQFAGFVAWYRGMALIGVARASQLQLAQPLLTLVWAVLLVGEQPSIAAPLTAVVVLGCIAVTQRSGAVPTRRRGAEESPAPRVPADSGRSRRRPVRAGPGSPGS